MVPRRKYALLLSCFFFTSVLITVPDGTLQILSIRISINTLLNKKQRVFELFLKAYWLKKIVERQRKEKHYYFIMVLTPQQQAALRAKKAIANGNTNFKPRGEKNKAAFEALKEQAQEAQTNISASNSVSIEIPLHKRIKIRVNF